MYIELVWLAWIAPILWDTSDYFNFELETSQPGYAYRCHAGRWVLRESFLNPFEQHIHACLWIDQIESDINYVIKTTAGRFENTL